MAFSLRKMLSNITYFKKPEDSDNSPIENKVRRHTYVADERILNYERDEDSRQCTSLKLPVSVKNFASKKGSLSDTDLPGDAPRRRKKLKLDIKKATQSPNDNIENTPKHVLLDCKSSDLFSERLKTFDFNKSFDIYDGMSDDHPSSPFEEENFDIESLSENSDSDISLATDEESPIKMCRKVDPNNRESSEDNELVPSTTPESFGDVEVDKNEEERVKLLLNYQMKLEKLECFLTKLLNEFQFHIEVSKVFNSRSIVTALPGTDVANIPKILGDVKYMDNISRGPSPAGSWNIVMEKEDDQTKYKLKKQLLSMKQSIDRFVHEYLQNFENYEKERKYLSRNTKSITFDIHKGERVTQKRVHMNIKKKMKHFDFPDLREAMINLFEESTDFAENFLSDTESESSKCNCKCHFHNSQSSETDSGLISKTNDRSMSITSSIGNFSLDSSTLTAYSESLDQIVSYNSFQDTSLYSTLLQKAAIERITFYVQVHSIQLKCDQTTQEFESKNIITFHCPSCKITETDENGLLKHILSQFHCEKIHFLYKTAYIKKCVSSGKEIQPSTVLNPMRMYRDENKIVCFGDALYACSLCFENLIVGESILMAHCSDTEHVERREKLEEIFE